MWYKKKGFPEEEELVLCTVTKILPHSVFVKLDEYQGTEGLIHISEITPGRVRNIRDFVKENKKLVCKVLRGDQKNNQVDLSLRRVNLGQRKAKLESVQFEEKAEKVLEAVGKKIKLPIEEMYKKVGFSLVDKYGSLSEAFQLLVDLKTEWKDVTADAKVKTELMDFVKEKIKPPEVNITGTLTLSSTDSMGVEVVKAAVKKAEDAAKKNNYKVHFSYLSAPHYKVIMYGRDFKTAEKHLTEVVSVIEKEMKNKGVFEFAR